jgi:hypothetical protein
MIQRFVFVRFRPEVQADAALEAIAAAVARVFPGLPGVTGAQVSRPADEQAAAGWDLCLTVQFDSIDAVPGYVDHPDHVAFVQAEMAPRILVKKSWNFETV